MSTSLAEQLQRLAVPQSAVLKRDKKRPSLLFDPKEAATLTRETVYQIAFEGYEELKNLNEAFAQFENTLFHVTSKEFERSIQDARANETLDKSIRKFFLLVSPYFLLSSAHKALEWLIHRFSVHEYNKSEFLLLILPYHETNIFVRALQLVKLKETNDNWFWLKSLQKPGIHLPKLALYNHAASDPHFLKMISNHVIEAVRLHENPNTLTILFNFFCLTFTGSLEYATQVNEAQVTQMLRVLLKGMESDVPDFCTGSYVVLAKLVSKTELSDKLLNKFVDNITHVEIPAFKRQATLLLVILYQMQKQFSEMSQQAIINLTEKPWIPKVLQDLKTAGYFVEPLLKVLFQEILKSALLEVASRNSKMLLNELLKEIKLEDAFVSNLIHVIEDSYKPNKEKYPEETKTWIRDFMWKLETQYPAAFDREVNEIMKVTPGNHLTKKQKRFRELLGNLHLEDKMTVFKKLHHPVPSIRQDAIRHIIGRYKHLKERDREFFSKTVLNKLRDENCEVVCETLIHLKKILTQLLELDMLKKVLIALLKKAQQRKDEWGQVLRPALEILCWIITDGDMKTFLQILPLLLPTDEDEFGAAQIIISSPYVEKCDFLRGLGSQLRRARTPEKFFAIIFDNLSVNANKPDTKELTAALNEVPESDRDVVHKYLASLLLCSSLQENCDPQLSAIVLDILLKYLDGSKLHAVKSEQAVSNYIIAARADKFPLQGFLYCLNTLILKTLPMAFNVLDLSKNDEASRFYCTLLDVLLRGCYSKKSLLYAETLKIYFNHFCGDFKSKIKFFLNVSIAECNFVTPALQLRCLHGVTSLLSTKQENISDFVNLDQIIVPCILASMVNKHREIRACAVNAVQVLLSIVGMNRHDDYTLLLKQVLKNKEDVVLDQTQAGVVISNLLVSKDKKFEAILKALLNLVAQERNRPFYLRAKVIEILSHVNNFQIFNRICGVALDVLKQEFDNQKSLMVCNCLRKLNDDVVSSLKLDTNVYRLLERALRSDVNSLSETTNLSILAIKQIDDEVFDSNLGFDVKHALLDVVIEVATLTQNPDVLSAAGQFFKHVNLDAGLVLKQLTQMRDVQSPKSLITLKRKRRVSVIPSADILETLVWKKGVTILEFVQSKKKIENSSVLLPLLFDVLKKCLDFDEQALLEYTKQLILSGILNLCDKIVEKEVIPENAFNMESIVQCIRASPNPQTHHHALLVLARASSFLPGQVLHHVMAVFTFMGSSVLRHDDAYSFQTINKIIDTIIPILVESERSESTLRILRVFVDAVLDVPEHRRIPLYKNLLERLNVKDNLHVFFLLIFEAHVIHVNVEKAKDGSSPKRLDVAKNLTLEFPADAVISSCIKLMEQLRALPEEKKEYMEVDSSLVLDVAHLTPKQFRHYKYVLVTYIVNLLTLPEFVNKIAALTDSELLELEPLYKTMIINTLMYIQTVSKISDRNSNTPHAQYWKVMLHHSYDILDSINALLTPQMFLLVIRGLTTHKLSAIQRRSLELLNSKLQHDHAFFDDCDESELYGMVPPLINIIKQVETEGEVTSEQELIIQTAILSLKLFIKRLAKEHPEKFVQILEFITNLVKAKKVRGNILASMILCLAELCTNLRAHAISSLTKFMPVVIKLLKIHKQEALPDLLLLSCVTAVQKIIDSLPLFLSPYLEKLLCELSNISAKWNAEAKDPKLVTFMQKLGGIQQKIGTVIPSRVLIPIIDATYKNLVGKSKFASIKPLMSVLSENLLHLTGPEIQTNIPDLTSFFLSALQFRADNLSSSLEVTSEVEDCIIKALATLILKLSESTFRPLYYKIFDWAIRSDAKNERIITFYALSSEVAHSLKGLFVLFAGHFLNNASAALDACNTIKSKRLYFDNDDKNIALTQSILKTLHGICLYDGQKFINKERFDVLMQPLVDQLENSLGGLESLANRAETLLIPCIVQFCVAAGDDALWKQLNYQVLLKARHSQPEIRLIALKCLNEVVKKLGEDFMPLLPETIPFLAELLEDDEETVEKACQKAVQEMEKVLGEPLQKYF